MTTSTLGKPLTFENSRLDNKILYLVYKVVIKDHIKLKNYINDQTGHNFLSIDIYDVKESDNILEPHTVVLFELTSNLAKRNCYNLFDYEKNTPSIYKATKGKAKLLKAYCANKEIRPISISIREEINTKVHTSSKEKEDEDEEKKKGPKKTIEVPLPIHGYTDYFPTVNLKSETVYSSGNKPLKMRIDNYLPGLNNELQHEYIFLTVCFLPNQITPRSAWELIPHFEKQIVDILFQFEEIKYILSSIEIHTTKDDNRKKDKEEEEPKKTIKKSTKESTEKPNKKVIIKIKKVDSSSDEESTPPKPKSTKKEEKDKDDIELLEDNIKLLLLTHNKYVHKLDRDTKEVDEILRVFRMYDENLTPSVVIDENQLETTITRAIKYAQKIEELKDSKWPTKYDNPKVLNNFSSIIYEKLCIDGGNITKKKPNKLIGYPHIHMAIARSKNITLEEHNSLNKYFRALNQPITVFSDIFIKDSMGSTAGKIPSSKAINDTSASNILAYCLKNSLHKVVHQNLDRAPCTLYNPHKLEKINKFFDQLIRNNKIIISNVEPCSSDPLEIKEYKKYDKDTQTFLEAKDRLAALMVKKNYRVCYDNTKPTIWTKIERSRNSWEEITSGSDLEDLWTEFIEKNNFEFRKYKRDLFDLLLSKVQRSFPKIVLDYQTIEFGDFFLHFNAGTFSEVDVKNPSFYYDPKYKLEDYIQDNIKKPKMWFDILINSKFLNEDGTPTEIGNILLKQLYELFLPKLHKRKSIALLGNANSGKTTIYAPLLKIYPEKKIGIISSSNGFESSNYYRKEILEFDEVDLNAMGIRQSDIKKLLEGHSQMNINQKNKDILTSIIKSRAIVSGNNMDAFSNNADTSKKLSFETSPVIFRERTKQEVQNYVVNKYNIDQAFVERLEFYTLTPLPKSKIVPDGKNIIVRTETAEILLYLAKLYGKIKHHTTLEELHETIADEYESCINRTITMAE